MRWSRGWIVAAVYVALLGAHHVLRVLGEDSVPPNAPRVTITDPVVSGTTVELAYREVASGSRTAVVVVHGVPGDAGDFPVWNDDGGVDRTVVAFDLPGFGHSPRIEDMSAASAARRIGAAIDSLGLGAVHLLGMGQGGNVVIELAGLRPDGVESLVLLGATGVQEFELLGNYDINHPLFGAQLAILWTADHLIPHFGLFERLPLNLSYARFFQQSDARPARAILQRFEAPVLILHGAKDFLVPPEVAREHARIVPHAELSLVDGVGHGLVTERPRDVRARLDAWLDDVESGRARVRSDADPDRVEAARVPIEAIRDFAAHGVTLWLLLVLIVFATFVSEDATSIGVGLLIAQGRVEWFEGFAAVFVGIYFGDLILYGVGHALGMTVVKWVPFRWFLNERDLRRGSEWFGRRGLIAIFLTRFLPGSRLPTYIAVGVVRAGFWRFAGFFFIAVIVWTPVLVGFAAVVGQEALARFEQMQRESLIVFGSVLAALMILLRGVLPLTRWRGRRLAYGRWLRWSRWEFWPSWIVYLPVVARVPGWARRYGGLTVPTAANWGMSGAGGMIGESKAQILDALGESPFVARHRLLRVDDAPTNLRTALDFVEDVGAGWPVVLKPDHGQRGEGVRIVRTRADLEQLLAAQAIDLMIQEYAPGEEFGILYVREPDAERGRIASICHKRPLLVRGDGRHRLEHLILDDPRAVALAPRHVRRHVDRLDWIPDDGEVVAVAEIGTHSRGAIFEDARDLWTPALAEAIDTLSRCFEGFHLGRYDLRVPSIEALRQGRDLRVIELNGLTSEPAHVYDAEGTLSDARAALVEHWESAFRIGAKAAADGHRVWPLRAVLGAWWSHNQRRRHHASDRAVGTAGDFTVAPGPSASE